MTDRSGNLAAIAQTNRLVVLADWLFTTPTVVLQPVTGVMLALHAGYPLSSSWLLVSMLLYAIAGLCWLPVVLIQIRMRDLSLRALADHAELDERHARLARTWFWLGVPAFLAFLALLALLPLYRLIVSKPLLWS